MRRGVGWFWRRGWQLVLQAVGADTTVDPAESSFSFDDYDITANSSSTATASIVARNAAGDPLANKTATLAFETVVQSAANSIVTCTTTEALNDGVESVVLTVQVRDASNRPIPDIPASDITFASTGTGNTLTQASASTNQAGNASGSMVSTVAEAKTITVTVRGVLITDTATATFSAAAAGSYTNEPVGLTLLGNWNNSVTIDSDGWVDDGNPNGTTGGNKSVVATGYTGTPSIGGTNVILSTTAGGQPGGYDPGRMQYSGLTAYDELFFGFEMQLPTGYPTSNNSGGNKIAIINFSVDGRYFLNFDTGGAGGNWDLYGGDTPLTSTLLESSTTPVTYGGWAKVEWYLSKAGSAGSHIIRVWVDGVLAIERTDLTFPTGENFSYMVFDGSNNGNRPVTGSSPEARIIATEYPGSATDADMYIADLYLSAA